VVVKLRHIFPNAFSLNKEAERAVEVAQYGLEWYIHD